MKKERPLTTQRLQALLGAVRQLKGRTGPGYAYRNLVVQEHTLRVALVRRGCLV